MADPRTDADPAGPLTAYIICGPESSGNRLVASILCRSGCTGEGSTRQPQTTDELPPATGPYVLIRHKHLTPWIYALFERGFERVRAILVVREPLANIRSMILRGHHVNFERAYDHRKIVIATNLAECLAHGIWVEIITYEGLSEPFLAEWLPRMGLPYVPGELSLPGQYTPSEITNQNAKHYR